MRQTLFYIPTEIYGVPLFGFGVLLAVWAVAAVVIIGYLVRKQGFNAETPAYIAWRNANPLRRWLDEGKGRSLEKVSVAIGCEYNTVCKWMSGLRFPRHDMMLKLQKATSNKVTLMSWSKWLSSRPEH